MNTHPGVMSAGNGCVLVEVPAEYVPREIIEASRPSSFSKLPEEDNMAPVQDANELAVMFYDDSFVCPLDDCNKVFNSSRNYRKHKSKFHKLSRFNCVQCSQPFDSYNELNSHMEQEKHVVKCTMCSHVFKRTTDAANHYGQKHRIFKCLYCAAPLHGKQIYKEHLKNHSLDDACYAASVLVETTMNTSFKDTPEEVLAEVHDGDKENDSDLQILEETSSRDILRATSKTSPESISGDNGVQVHSESDERGRGRETVSEEAVSDTLPYSTCHVNLDHTTSLNGENCSDTDTADAELPSDTDSASEVTNGTLIRNPFYEPSFSCPIMFGPGADELLENGSGATPSNETHSNNNQDVSEWIGHNVGMYQSMSEKHKKTFRYNCGKCALTFKSKEKLKRHARIHEHVCKHCFLRFTSLPEYKTHLSKHTAARFNYICSVCGHNLQDVKSLMVHEMRHRLNNAFKRKLEGFTHNNNLGGHQSHYECEVCMEKIGNLSLWLRHEIWHDWSTMWTSYVVGRIFLRAFTEQDTKKFEKTVEDELRMKWRDCKKPESARHVLASSEHSEVAEHSTASYVSDDTTLAEEFEDNTLESDSESEFLEDGTHHAVSGWMNYWCSYLGVNESTPSWVVPILKQLRLQWKEYDAEEHDSLYRKMDQIGVLIRSERKGVSISEGPRVVLQRLPTSNRAQNASLLRQKCGSESPLRESHGRTASTSMLQSSSKEKNKDKDQVNISKMPGSRKKSTENPCTELSCPSKLRSSMTGSIMGGLHKQDVIITNAPGPNFHLKIGDNTPITSKSRKRTRSSVESNVTNECIKVHNPLSSMASTVCPSVLLHKLVWPAPKPRDQSTQTLHSPVKVMHASKNPTIVPSSPSINECIRSPTVLLSKLVWPTPNHGELNPVVLSSSSINASPVSPTSASPVSPTTASPKQEAVFSLPSVFLKLKWIMDQTGSETLPKWVHALVKEVHNNPSLSPALQVGKLHQIINLIKLGRGDNVATCQTPLVSLKRL